MTTYILTALSNDKFTKALNAITSDVVYLTSPAKLSSINELHKDDEKIIVIDPDFVDWEVSQQDLSSIPNLKAVLVSSTSFGWVDQNYLNEKNIPLINVKDWCTHAVAEYAIMMTFNLVRKMPLLIKDGFPLDYEKYCGFELKGKTTGIIGMGNIGKALTEKLNGLGMKVVYWSKNSKTDKAEYISLEKLFQSSDFIFPTMADNTETQQIITDNLLKSLMPSSYFVSIVHRYYNHNLLLEMVKDGNLSGYGFEDSKTKMSDYVGNIWVAPEYAWCTRESFETNDKKLLDNIKSALSGNYDGKVNFI